MQRPSTRHAAPTAWALASLVLPFTALAQAPADTSAPVATLSQDEIDEIIVTGSRIARPELTAMSPFAVLGEEAIRLSNANNIEEFLRKAPQFAQAVGGNTNNGNDGATRLDLRNLREERTLVLVNGKRFVPYDYQGYVDVGMIPTSLVERVEIITGGASAVYGADAVAGVVNFILKDDFEGMEVNGGYGVTDSGDGESYDINATVGGNFAGGRGNVVFNMGYTKENLVTQGERAFSSESLDNLLDPSGSFTVPGSTILDGGFPGDVEDGCIQFDTAGEPVSCTETFNFNPFNLLKVPQQRWVGTALGNYDITDDLEFFGRASFANNRVDTQIAPTGTFFFPFQIFYNDNFFLTQAARDRFALVDAAEPGGADGAVDVSIGRRLVELGTRDTQYENTAYQFLGGLRGSVLEDQDWELFAQYGRTSRTQNFLNDNNYDRVQQALDAIDDGFGNPVCRDPSNGCVPANIFGEGNLDPAVPAFISLGLNETNKADQLIFGGSLSGDLPFQLPTAGANVGYAAGVEYRHEQATNRPDANYEAGNAPGFGSSSKVDAEVEIQEIYAELLVPILEDLPFARAINVETGVRYAEYENTANVGPDKFRNRFYNTSWKFGGDWVVVDDFRFSGMYQRAVRAPTIQEIGLPFTASTGDLSYDPCDSELPPTDPALIALCEATGVPVGSVGTFTSISAGQINNYLSGNPELEPEDADTVTIGFDWTPGFIEGLEVSLDYYDIEIDDAIVEISEQNIVTGCYRVEQDPNGELCSRINRNPITGGLIGGTETGVDRTRVNAASETAEGIDLLVRYAFDVGGAGTIDLGLQANYVLERIIQDTEQTPANDCAGLAGKTCLRPVPELTFNQITRWTSGPAAVQLVWRYIDGVEQDALALEFFAFDPVDNPEGAQPSQFAVQKIASQSYFDLTGSYDIDDTWTVRAGINNLLDRDPPIVGNEWGGTTENSGNTFPATYDTLGRAYFVGANARF